VKHLKLSSKLTRIPQSAYLREALDDLLRNYSVLRKGKSDASTYEMALPSGGVFVCRRFTLLCFAYMTMCERKAMPDVPSIQGGRYANRESNRRSSQKRR